jgi:hypothetical protein
VSGAIELIAYGVLEYKPLSSIATLQAAQAEYRAQIEHNEEIMQLAMNAFKARSWLLSYSSSSKYRFVLHGPLTGSFPLRARELIAHGTLRDVCLVAIEREKLFLEDPDAPR